MPGPEIRVFENLEELSREAASQFAELASLKLREKGIFCSALSGGSTPRRLYELLGEPRVRVEWQRVHLFQVDERCVPPDHPESNCRMIREALLCRAPIPQPNFHRMAAEQLDREAAAREYAEKLRRVLGPKEGGWPALDLIFLGMGGDGHTASLFPGSPALKERTLWVRPNYSERLKSYRLTLTLPVLNAARQIIFLVAGADKADTLREVFEGAKLGEALPAARVRPIRGQVYWYLDKAAAGSLGRGLA